MESSILPLAGREQDYSLSLTCRNLGFKMRYVNDYPDVSVEEALRSQQLQIKKTSTTSGSIILALKHVSMYRVNSRPRRMLYAPAHCTHDVDLQIITTRGLWENNTFAPSLSDE